MTNANRNGVRDHSTLPHLRNLTSLWNQRWEDVAQDFPKFPLVLYDFLLAMRLGSSKDFFGTMRDIEHKAVTLADNIPENHLLRRYVISHIKDSRGNVEMVQGLVSKLEERGCHSQFPFNLSMIWEVGQLGATPPSYLQKMLASYQEQFALQAENGTNNLERETKQPFQFGSGRRDFKIGHSTLGQIVGIVADFVDQEQMVFTEEQLAAFFKKFPVIEVDGRRTIEGTPESLDDLLLFSFVQSVLIIGRETSRRSIALARQLTTLKLTQPALFAALPECEQIRATLVENVKDKLQSFAERQNFAERVVT